MRRTHWVVLALAGFCGFGAGCSSSKSADTTSPTLGTSAHTSVEIGASGGSISLEAATLVVPAGALSASTTITLTSTTSAPPAGYVAWSAVYKFEPDGLVFAIPASVSFQPSAGAPANAVIYWSTASNDGFVPLATTRDGTAFKAAVVHFSGGMLGDPMSPGSDGGSSDGGPGDDGGPGSTCSLPAACGSPACSTTCTGTDVAVCTPPGMDKMGGCAGGANSCSCTAGASGTPWATCMEGTAPCSPACSVMCSGAMPYAVCTNAIVDKMGGCTGSNTCTCEANAPYLTCSAPSTCGPACTATCAAPMPYAQCNSGMDKAGCVSAPTCGCSPTP